MPQVWTSLGLRGDQKARKVEGVGIAEEINNFGLR
jgi:hypothetical protein